MNWRSKEGRNLIASFFASLGSAFIVGVINFNNFCEENRVQSSSCHTLQYQNLVVIFFTFGFVFGLILVHYTEFLEKVGWSLVSEIFMLVLSVLYVGILIDGEYLFTGLFAIIFDFGSHISNVTGLLVGSFTQKVVFGHKSNQNPDQYPSIKY